MIRNVAATSLLLAASACAAAEAAFPAHFTARYSVAANGRQMGEMTRRLEGSTSAGEYVFRSELKATRGLLALLRVKVVETSRWRLQGESIVPLEYEYRLSGPKKRLSRASFDWRSGVASVLHKEQAATIATPPGVLDKLLYQLVLMRDLEAGGALRYTVLDGHTLKEYPIVKLGRERIETPIGTLDTVKIEHQRPGKARRTTLWCAESLGYLPVKLDHLERQGEQTSALIESVSGL